jgi:ABC-2 type transport system permease protein
MRTAAARNTRLSRLGIAAVVGAIILGLITAGSTFMLGFTAPLTGGDAQLSLLVLVWAIGRIGFAAFSGADPIVPLDLLRTLPVARRPLARALLLAGFTDPSIFFLALAFGSLIVFGFRLGAVEGVVAIAGTALTLALVSALSTAAAALVPTGSRRRQDIGTLLAAAAVSAVLVLGTLIPALLAALASGRAPAIAAVVRVLPTGWTGGALDLWSSGWPAAGVAAVLALIALLTVVAAWWPRVLAARLVAEGGSARRHGHGSRRHPLATRPTAAVAAKELRLWVRDPLRAGFLLIAVIVGLGVCVVPLLSHGTSILLPFAGIGTALIAGAVAGNTFGYDGPALVIPFGIPGGARAEVRGRQRGWLLLIGPYSVLLSIVGLVVCGQVGLWPWVLSLLAATIGSASGIAILTSALSPQPLDDRGGPTPAWTLKAYAALLSTAICCAPVLAALIAGAVTGLAWLTWAAVPLGVLTGVTFAVIPGRIAGRVVERTAPELVVRLPAPTGGRR